MFKPSLCLLATATALASTVAHAELFDRGGGLIYDSTLDVTWLQDANYAKTSGYDADGLMTFDQAQAWAAGLSYVDSARGQTLTGWRLPLASPVNGVDWQVASTYDGSTDRSYNTTSPAHEYAHLFHVDLGNRSVVSPTGVVSDGSSGVDYGMVHSGPFVGTQNAIYWYGMGSPFDSTLGAGFLGYSGGSLASLDKSGLYYAWALRPGDVGPVPEPGTLALWLAGLAVMAARVRRGARGAA